MLSFYEFPLILNNYHDESIAGWSVLLLVTFEITCLNYLLTKYEFHRPHAAAASTHIGRRILQFFTSCWALCKNRSLRIWNAGWQSFGDFQLFASLVEQKYWKQNSGEWGVSQIKQHVRSGSMIYAQSMSFPTSTAHEAFFVFMVCGKTHEESNFSVRVVIFHHQIPSTIESY